MTTTKQFKDAVKAAVALAGGVSVKSVTWERAGKPIGGTLVRLLLGADVSETPDPRQDLTANEAGTLAPELSQSRLASVQIRCETINADTASDAHAKADEIEIGLSLQAVTAALATAGVVYVQAQGQTDISFWVDDCQIFARAFDAQFRYVYTRTDPTPVGVIEHVQVSGQLDIPPNSAIAIGTVDKPVPD